MLSVQLSVLTWACSFLSWRCSYMKVLFRQHRCLCGSSSLAFNSLLLLNLKCIFLWRNILKEQEHNWQRNIDTVHSPQSSDRKDWWLVFHSYGIVYISFPNHIQDWRSKHLFMVPCNHGRETKQTTFRCDLQTAAFSFINNGHGH